MVKLFPEYAQEVLEGYHKKVASGQLSSRLSRPTPAKIRDECVDVCRTRYLVKDEKALEMFFGRNSGQEGYLRVIKGFDVDKFKPLINFLKDGKIKTDDKNVELLAWLIDFQTRPFEYGRPIMPQTEEPSNGEKSAMHADGIVRTTSPLDSGTGTIGPDLTTMSVPRSGIESIHWQRKWKWGIVIVVAFITFLSGFNVWNASNTMRKASNGDSCMFWKEDHYEKISCGRKMKFAEVIALDQYLLDNFKKITSPDTITQKSIGKVWYSKINGEREYFTAMGYHPVKRDVQLKPITEYILINYILKHAAQDLSINASQVLNAENPADETQTSIQPYKKPISGIYGQCLRITKKKTRCTRNARSNGYCWQHGT